MWTWTRAYRRASRKNWSGGGSLDGGFAVDRLVGETAVQLCVLEWLTTELNPFVQGNRSQLLLTQ